MEYTYNILNEIYYFILSGMKTIEVRLLNEKSENILINDYIIFNNIDDNDRYIKTKVIKKVIYNNFSDLIINNDVNKIMPNHTADELKKLLFEIYGERLNNHKIIAFEFQYMTSDLDIEISTYKGPYIKQLTNDNIINLTGQSGSGKSTFARENFSSLEYEIIDTDIVFNDKMFEEASGLNKKLGLYFRQKYKKVPSLNNDFDLIYTDIIKYCQSIDKTIIIDCAQFHSCKDIKILKGKIIILRTDVDTCYNRVISRWINMHKERRLSYNQDDLSTYMERKKAIYSWYLGSNEFIRKIDCLYNLWKEIFYAWKAWGDYS